MTIETNSTDRKSLAKAISERLLDAPVKYLGIPTYAYQVGTCVTIDRQGNLEITDKDALAILKPYFIEQGWLEAANEAAIPEPTVMTVENMEISFRVPAMTVAALKNLIHTLYSKQYLLNRVTGQGTFVIPELLVHRLTEYTPETLEEFTDLLDDVKAMEGMTGFDFRDLTVTLSFPFDETQPTHWVYYGDLAHRIVEAAQEATRVVPTLQQPENEKYFMRSWLLRLGYGGADSKAARAFFLRNLKGHTAFPSSEAADKHKAKYAEIRRIDRELREDSNHERNDA